MKKFLLIFTLALVALPLLASAASQPIKSNVWDPTILKGPLVTCWGGPMNGDGTANSNSNACENLCDLVSTILNVIYYVIAFVIWIVVPIDVAVGGIMYMFAGPDPGMVAKAKTVLLGAAWGVAIVLCSYVIVSTFVAVFKLTGVVGGFGTAACQVNAPTSAAAAPMALAAYGK